MFVGFPDLSAPDVTPKCKWSFKLIPPPITSTVPVMVPVAVIFPVTLKFPLIVVSPLITVLPLIVIELSFIWILPVW